MQPRESLNNYLESKYDEETATVQYSWLYSETGQAKLAAAVELHVCQAVVSCEKQVSNRNTIREKSKASKTEGSRSASKSAAAPSKEGKIRMW